MSDDQSQYPRHQDGDEEIQDRYRPTSKDSERARIDASPLPSHHDRQALIMKAEEVEKAAGLLPPIDRDSLGKRGGKA